MNYLDFHSLIQPQPEVNNLVYRDDESQGRALLWSDEDCDYIFSDANRKDGFAITTASSAVVPCGTASSSLQSNTIQE